MMEDKKDTLSTEDICELSAKSAYNMYCEGNVEGAGLVCGKTLEKNPAHVKSLQILGLINLLKKNYEAASCHIDKALDIDEENAFTCELKGRLSLSSKLYNQAVYYFRSSLFYYW